MARALCFWKAVLQRAQLPLSFCHSLFSWAPSVLSPPAEPLSQQQRQQHPISFVLISHGGTLGGSHSTLHTLCPLQASSCPGSSSLWEQSLYLVTLGHAMTTWSLIAKQDHRWCCSHSAPVVQPTSLQTAHSGGMKELDRPAYKTHKSQPLSKREERADSETFRFKWI